MHSITDLTGYHRVGLRLWLPEALAEEQGKYLFIPGVWFKYGHEQVLAALESNGEYAAFRRKHGKRRLASRAWAKRSATGSIGMRRAGGCS